MLILPIKKKWFDMIKSGEKKEEYREIKPYWTNRFYHFKLINNGIYIEKPQYIIFRNGYSNNSPSIKCKCFIRTGQGKQEWGAEPNKEYYVLEILSVQNKGEF